MNYNLIELPRFETDRLILRAIKQDDCEDLYEYAKRENVGPRAGWPPHKNRDQTKEIILNMQSSMLAEDNIGVFAIILKKSNKMIGTVGLHKLNQKVESAELGYVLSPDYWGRGIMKEACTAVIKWCFEELDLYRLECGHFDFNSQSRRVIEKLGFKFEGISRMKAVLPDKSRHDQYNYSMLKKEYNKHNLPW